ncbi:MAG: hypothetical protein J2P22_02340 [Nocardioides sp.]|nr:hypothetical protein [Nocardioides sp.]
MSDLLFPQPGILALGTAAHAYLELDVADPEPAPEALLAAIAEISGRLVTGQGGNVVVGFRSDRRLLLPARHARSAGPTRGRRLT